MNAPQEAINEFLIESHENLSQLDQDLVELEKDPRDANRLASIFRTLHTLKGSAAFLGFIRLETVAHAGENLLSRVRQGSLELTMDMTTTLLVMVDTLRRRLSHIEAAGGEGEIDDTELVNRLKAHQDETAPRPMASQLLRSAAEPAPSILDSLIGTETGSSMVADATVRVPFDVIDRLVTLASELVLARNQIVQFTSRYRDVDLLNSTRTLSSITTELQEAVMRTRMQPIGNIWQKFPRLVRDLAVHCGKKVRLEMEGGTTALDKTIIEAVKDPLTHLVRNAVDHGIEPPAARLVAGKTAEGRLFLRAYHEGGLVNIEVSDDGAGIDLARVSKKAVDTGLVQANEVDQLESQTLLQMVFTPAFSTASKVTTLSGRGVGLDVVKSNVERIGGTVDVQSQRGRGTTFKMRIPLTLAIIRALIVQSRTERYAIPLNSIVELVRLEQEKAERGVEWVHGAPVYRFRGKLLPIVSLEHLLAAEPGAEIGLNERLAAGIAQGVLNLVVLRADDREFGLAVGKIQDSLEIVVKPLAKQLQSAACFAGTTIMGDGRVALILDVIGLALQVGVKARGLALPKSNVDAAGPADAQKPESFLLVETEQGRRFALPLAIVGRLEEFDRQNVEQLGSVPVVWYLDQVLPLVDLGAMLSSVGSETAPGALPAIGSGSTTLHVIISTAEGRQVGLVVDRILDILEQHVTARGTSVRENILYSALVDGRLTEFPDIPRIVRSFASTLPAAALSAGQGGHG